MTTPLRVLVAGCGNMGASHARAYHKMPEFEIVGVVSRGAESRNALSQELGGVAAFADYYDALKTTKPDVVSINTYPETHAAYARAAIGPAATSSAKSRWPKPSPKRSRSSTARSPTNANS